MKKINFQRCLMVSTWTSWSPCSVSCGKGSTVRTRSFLKPELKQKCKAQLIEHKACMIVEKCLDENLISATERTSTR